MRYQVYITDYFQMCPDFLLWFWKEISLQPNPAPERLLHRVKAAAHILDVSTSQLYVLVNRGDLEAVRVGRSIRISADALKRLAASGAKLEAR